MRIQWVDSAINVSDKRSEYRPKNGGNFFVRSWRSWLPRGRRQCKSLPMHHGAVNRLRSR